MTFEGDGSGEEFAQLLIDKASEGVAVRLLLDHYSDVIADDILPFRLHRHHSWRAERERTRLLLERLTRSKVALHRTAPSGHLHRYLLYRNHKKMVLIDGHVAFVGGINISDHNYAWHDFMTRVSGPIVTDVQRDFDSTWGGTTIPLDPPRATGDFVLNQCPGRAAILDEIIRMIDGATSDDRDRVAVPARGKHRASSPFRRATWCADHDRRTRSAQSLDLPGVEPKRVRGARSPEREDLQVLRRPRHDAREGTRRRRHPARRSARSTCSSSRALRRRNSTSSRATRRS